MRGEQMIWLGKAPIHPTLAAQRKARKEAQQDAHTARIVGTHEMNRMRRNNLNTLSTLFYTV